MDAANADKKGCKRCGEPMFHLAAVCPHCGARQMEAPEPPASPAPKGPRAPLHLSSEEAKALIALHSNAGEGLPQDSGAGLVSWLLFPQLRGARRSVEIALTLASLPLIVAAILTVGWTRFKSRRLYASSRGLALWAVPTTALSLSALWLTEGGGGWEPVAGIGAMLAAWMGREVLRWRTRAALWG